MLDQMSLERLENLLSQHSMEGLINSQPDLIIEFQAGRRYDSLTSVNNSLFLLGTVTF